jgi:hypothetical protein
MGDINDRFDNQRHSIRLLTVIFNEFIGSKELAGQTLTHFSLSIVYIRVYFEVGCDEALLEGIIREHLYEQLLPLLVVTSGKGISKYLVENIFI